jgi:N-acetylglucosaminyldiphosphoundecaprenol N-acetyl-beta-D-mannosaminyltransferase
MASSHSLKTRPGAMALPPWFSTTGGVSRVRLAYIRAMARHWIVRLAGACGRMVDLVVCIGLLPLGAALCIAHMASLASGGGLRGEDYIGRDGKTFRLYRLDFGGRNAPRWLCRLPVLLNLLRGDLGLVGPRPLRMHEAPRRNPEFWTRSSVRPGVISLFWLRQRTNIAFQTELATDVEYVNHKSVRTDLGIALRAAPASLYGSEALEAPSIVPVFGVAIHNLRLRDAVDQILQRSAIDSAPVQVCFVNADCLNIAYRDPEYFELLEHAFLVLPDGIGLKLAGRLLRRPIRQNVNGTDMFPQLCAGLARTGRRLFLLGGRPGVPEAVAGWVQQHAPGLTVCGLHHGYFTPEEEESLIAEIAASRADLLLVALGAPRQDQWISVHLQRLSVRVAVGVGGLFDFYSGLIPRAPQWLRELGLEWLYRFLQEPRRMWRRYFVGNVLFLYRVGRERLGMSPPHHIAAQAGGEPT